MDELLASPAEHRFWCLSQFTKRAKAHTWPVAIEVSGPVDFLRLKNAWKMLIERQEILRTKLEGGEFELRRCVTKDVPESQAIYLHDLIDPNLIVAAGLVRELISKDKATVSDPSEFPTLLCRCIRISRTRESFTKTLILVTGNSFVLDNSSVSIMWRELSALYNGETLPSIEESASELVFRCNELEHGASNEIAALAQDIRNSKNVLIGESGDFYEYHYCSKEIASEKLTPIQNEGEFMKILRTFCRSVSDANSGMGRQRVATSTSLRRAESVNTMGYFTNRTLLTFDPNMNTEGLKKDLQKQIYGNLERPIIFESLVRKEFPDEYVSCAPVSQVMFAMAQRPNIDSLQFDQYFAVPKSVGAKLERFLLLVSASSENQKLSLDAYFREDFRESAKKSLDLIEREVTKSG